MEATTVKARIRFLVKIILIPVITLALITGTLAYFQLVPGITAEAKEVLPGIKVEGVDLSNLERTEGISRLETLEKKLSQVTVDLVCGNSMFRATLAELGVSVDRDATMDRALAYGENLGVFKRWYAEVRPVERSLTPVLAVDLDKLRQALQGIIGPLEVSAVNARLEFGDDNSVRVIPSSKGYKVEIGLLADKLATCNISGETVVKVPVSIDEPELDTEEVAGWGVTGLVAEYTTRFKPEQVNRNHNISKAAAKLDGVMLKPDEVFSFNQVVGPRSAEQGYLLAGVIVGNKLEEGLGGGVCQVSTTLYNAVLLAGLDVVQRSNHNIPVNYVPLGFDAAVAYDYLDFKFRNNSGSHVVLKTVVRGNALTVKVFGAPDPARKVHLNSRVTKVLEPETVYKVDPAVKQGQPEVVQEGAKGFKVVAERVTFINGIESGREKLASSSYQPVERVIAVHSPEEIPKETPGGNGGKVDGSPVTEGDTEKTGGYREDAQGSESGNLPLTRPRGEIQGSEPENNYDSPPAQENG